MTTTFKTRACNALIFSTAREVVAKNNGIRDGHVVLVLECDGGNDIAAYVVPYVGAAKEWPIIASLGGPPTDPAVITIVHLTCCGAAHAHATKDVRRAGIPA